VSCCGVSRLRGSAETAGSRPEPPSMESYLISIVPSLSLRGSILLPITEIGAHEGARRLPKGGVDSGDREGPEDEGDRQALELVAEPAAQVLVGHSGGLSPERYRWIASGTDARWSLLRASRRG